MVAELLNQTLLCIWLVNLVQVIPESCADISGLRFNDVIIQCAGETIGSFLKVYCLVICFLEYILYDFLVNAFFEIMRIFEEL